MNSVLKMARARKAICVLGAILGVLLFSVGLFSQGSNGRILGTVTDQSGGVVSGATITIIDKDRGVARTLTTDDAGEYNAPQLLPGTYTVRAEANGFKKLERENIELGVGKEVRADLTVQPGTQAQTVTVTESIPLVETTNATLGGTLNNADINDLPLNGRNFASLMGLRPGVVLQPGGSPWTQSTNNIRPDESSWMVDGVLNANAFDARPVAGASSPFTDGALIMPLDAIQEFNIEENPKAEYGGKPGAMVNVGIRSGTNTLHGTAYAFGRDGSSWDARNVFNPGPRPGGSCLQSTCDQLAANLEQFGGSVGGPIKKDKLFFFANYEGLRSNIANALPTAVPETASGGGAKLSMVDALLGLQAHTITPSPLSLGLFGCRSTVTAASTCTGGVIQNLGAGNASSQAYLSTFPNTNTSDNGVAKLDYRVNDKNSINGMLYRANYNSIGEDFPMLNTAWEDNVAQSAWTTSANWIYTASSRLVNEARVGYNRFTFQFLPADRNQSANGSYALNGTTYPIDTGVTTNGGFPTVTIKGAFGPTTQLGSRRGRPLEATPNPYFDFQDNVSYLKGKHSFKYGFQFSHIEGDSDPHDTRGIIQFLGGQAFKGSTALEDFFAGLPAQATLLTGNPNARFISRDFGVFAQDDYRLTTKLMINLGLRWEYRSPFHEVNNDVGNFDPTLGLVQQGQASVGNTLWKPDYKNWSPRIGFAYDVTGKGTTVVRGGASILYSMFSIAPFTGNPGIANVRGGPSFVNIPTGACTTPVPAGATCPQTVSSGGTILNTNATILPASLNWNGVVFPSSVTPVVNANSPISIGAVNPNLRTPSVDNWSLGVQHAFTSNLSLDVEYVGTHAENLIGNIDLNQAPLGAAFCLNAPLTAAQLAGACNPANPTPPTVSSPSLTALQEARPYNLQFPYLQYIDETTNDGHSNYNSLQVTVTERPLHGLSFTGGYTYGHGLDNGSLNRFGGQPQNSLDPQAEYGNSDFDIRHRATITASYDIPGKKGFGQVLEGWKVNAIVTLQGSQPWNIVDTGDEFSGTQESTDRWDFFGNPSDFKDTSSSIPYCTGPGLNGCSTTSGVSTIQTFFSAAQSTAMWNRCTAVAPDPRTLAQAGCYVGGNSVMVPPVLGTFGTMARNIFRDAGFKNVDFSVFKNFKFTERFGAQFRAEFFNVLNHPNITNPFGSVNGSALGSDPSGPGTFGCGCATADFAAGNPIVGSGDARAIQLGFKLMF